MTTTTAPLPPLVQIVVTASGTTCEVVVAGELDLGTGSELVDVAAVLASYRVPVVELDLAGVSFIDTAGWRAVERSLDVLAEVGSVAAVVRRSARVDHLLGVLTATPR
ncbi:MAG: STAS domain-containing protein [Acidimicrobiales bacterium]